MKQLKELLEQDSWNLSLEVIVNTNLKSALVLAYLVEIDNGEEFHVTVDTICKVLNIKPYTVGKSLKLLKEEGYIDYKLKGVPAKRFFTILKKGY